MGHCDSPAQLSRDGGVFGAGRGTAGAVAACGEGRAVGAAAKSLGAWALLAFLRLYMLLLAPIVGGACKFYPSCSNYAYEAVSRHGARRGGILAIKRLLRCRPFTQGGFDPVPDELQEKPSPAEVADATVAANLKASAEPDARVRGLELRQ